MTFHCILLAVLIYPGNVVETYTSKTEGKCPPPEQTQALLDSLEQATGAMVKAKVMELTLKEKPDQKT